MALKSSKAARHEALSRRQQLPPPRAEGAAGSKAAQQSGGTPPAWDLTQRISGDAASMIMSGEPFTAELILKKGVAEIQEEHPGDPSLALLHTQLWQMQNEEGRHAEALEQAEAAYALMLSYFGEDSADAAFHGIRVGISLIASGGDIDRAQQLLVNGGTCAQHNLEIFWNRLQELEAENSPDAPELALHTKKLMVALADCNFYGAVGVVRKALQNAEELEVPMSDLENAWLSGVKQMAMALPPDHPLFAIALRELARLVPDAAGRPTLQKELEEVQQKLQELLYLLKQLPDSMKADSSADGSAAAAGDAAAGGEEEFLP